MNTAETMGRSTKKAIARAVLDEYGTTFAEELGLHPEKNTPAELFRLFLFALLASARISGSIAVRAAEALSRAGWTTPKRMEKSTWRERTDVLNRSGYARYDERTSRMLGETVSKLLEKYGGDLRKLRARAENDPVRERELLEEFKGIGDVGVDIFFREVQLAWGELFPFADAVPIESAKKLGLGGDAKALAKLVPRRDFPRFLAGLFRIEKAKAHDEVREHAA